MTKKDLIVPAGCRVLTYTEGYCETVVAYFVVPPHVSDEELWEAVNYNEVAERHPEVEIYYV